MQLTTLIHRYLQDRARRACAETTLRTYSDQFRLLLDFLDSLRIRRTEQVRPRHLENWVRYQCARKLSPITIRKRFLAVRSLFFFARKKRYVRRDPAGALPIPKAGKRVPKALKPSELAHLLNRAAWIQDANVKRDYALITLALDSGMRREEMRRLDIQDLDLAHGLAHVRHGKGDKERWTVFLKSTARALRAYIDTRLRGALFLGAEGKRLSAVALYRIIRRRAHQCGKDLACCLVRQIA